MEMSYKVLSCRLATAPQCPLLVLCRQDVQYMHIRAVRAGRSRSEQQSALSLPVALHSPVVCIGFICSAGLYWCLHTLPTVNYWRRAEGLKQHTIPLPIFLVLLQNIVNDNFFPHLGNLVKRCQCSWCKFTCTAKVVAMTGSTPSAARYSNISSFEKEAIAITL